MADVSLPLGRNIKDDSCLPLGYTQMAPMKLPIASGLIKSVLSQND